MSVRAAAGWWVLTRTFLRRDRRQVAWWSVGVAVLYVSQGVGVDGLYATPEELARAAEAMEDNAALVAMAGPARALDTVGGQVMWQSSAFGAVAVGVMAMLLVVRHTRAEEEQGREELVRSTAVGRAATLVATAVAVGLACVAVGTLTGLTLVGYGLPVADSLAVGAGLALCGLVLTGTALVAAQVASTSRGALGLAGAVVGAAYAARAVGDVTGSGLSMVSPLGWYQAMHPYSGLHWWPALLLLAGAATGAALAAWLFARRDLGGGLVATRSGPSYGGRRLAGSLALAWRLQRGSVLAWSTGLLLMGLAYGSIGDEAGEMVGDSGLAEDLFRAGADDLVDGFFAVSAVLLGLVATGFALASASRVRAQEESGAAELLLATGVSRARWLAGQVGVTALGTCLVLLAGAVGLGGGYALVSGDVPSGLRVGLPVLAQVAPVLVVVGLSVLLVGVAPRLQGAAWAGLVGGLVVLLLGDVLRLPGWLRWLSPYEHLAPAPLEPLALGPVAVLLLLALGLVALGASALRRRDIG